MGGHSASELGSRIVWFPNPLSKSDGDPVYLVPHNKTHTFSPRYIMTNATNVTNGKIKQQNNNSSVSLSNS